jgi:uncharacterized protein (DUF1778 family)
MMNSVATPAQIQVRTSIQNKDWLKRAADAQERSVNWLIHKMFTDARLAAEGKENAMQ